MMRILLSLVKILLGSFLIFLLYVLGCIIYGTYTDFQPPQISPLAGSSNKQDSLVLGQKLSLLNWNIGYAGLGASSNFFYDDGRRFFSSGGKMVRNSSYEVQQNLEGIAAFLKNHPSDFVLLQEVDLQSRRSYFKNQHRAIAAIFPNYTHFHALNYAVKRVPIPLLMPWDVIGQVKSGLSAFSKYSAFKASRHQFPGSYDWPNYIFHLDRCMLVQYFHTQDSTKKLILINTHNSAYDNGQLKAKELQYFKDFVLKKYQEGHYIVVGGDWNQTPPNEACNQAAIHYGIEDNRSYCPSMMAADLLPSDWQWAYDIQNPTNRSLRQKYIDKQTSVSLVDYFLVSPNVKVHRVRGYPLKFEHSDHNPVSISLELIPDTLHQKEDKKIESN